MEDEAIKALKKCIFGSSKIEKADEETDVSHMVDLVMTQNNEVKAGIQVKPDSFLSHEPLPMSRNFMENWIIPFMTSFTMADGNWTNYLSVISHFL